MARELPGAWPTRPKGFYTEWEVFSREAINVRLRSASGDALAAVVLASGAVLGGTAMLGIVKSNAEPIDRIGREWGIPKLATALGVGGGLLGVAIGGAGAAWLSRTLAQRTTSAQIEQERRRLTSAQQQFAALRTENGARRLPPEQHKLEVERLFWTITQGER